MSFINGVSIYLVIIVISYIFWNYFRKMFFIRKLNTIPGPKTLPLIGSFHHFLVRNNDVMRILLRLTEDYPSLCQIWMGNKLFIAIYEPDEAKSRNCLEKSMLYKFLPPLLNTGLLAAPASMWTRLRKMTAPTFSSPMFQGFFNTFVEQSATLTYELEKVELNENEIILVKHLSIYAWRIACDTIMGAKLEPDINNQCVKIIQRIKKVYSHRVMNICIYFSDIIFNLTALGREQKKNLNFLKFAIDKMIQQNEKEQTHRSFFNIQMDACRKENFTQDEIYTNILTMLATASDTIASAINFVIFMLANFPEIQEKVYEELLEIYGMETIKSAPIKYDDLQYMNYTERVIKETMRLFPPGPIIGRQLTEDIKIGEVVLPKGTDVMIGVIKIHRDEKYWPNPLVFDPDRFLPERIKDCHPCCYIPFSDGPRNCIGMKYGMMCMKVMLATLARTFIFKVNKSVAIDKINLQFNMLLTTTKPLKVKIEKRNFQ